MSIVRRPATVSQAARPSRALPELWVEGSQKPRFDLRAFGSVSLALARAAASPALIWSAGMTEAGAARIARNRIGPRLAAMGRVGRALPAREGVSSGFVALAALLSAAADIAVPPPPAPEPEQPDLFRSALPVHIPRRPQPRLPDPVPSDPVVMEIRDDLAAKSPDPDTDAPTLAAIRAMIADLRQTDPASPRRIDARAAEPVPPQTRSSLLISTVPLTPQEPRPLTLLDRAKTQLFHASAVVLGWTVTVLALPVGATRAAIAHLNGENLRDWAQGA